MKRILSIGLIALMPSLCFSLDIQHKTYHFSEAEEILLQLEVPGVTTQDIFAYRQDDALFLPIGELFLLLGIKADFRAGNTHIEGIYIDNQEDYTIDLQNETISLGRQKHTISDEHYLIEDTEVYLHEAVFSEVFGLNTKFNYRDLSVALSTGYELPAVREQRIKQARSNLDEASGQREADQTIPLQRNAINGWMMNWNYSSSASQSSTTSFRNNFSLDAGGELAGGDFFISGNVSDQYGINRDRLRGRYRFVTGSKWLDQVIIGNLTSHIRSRPDNLSINGLELTNRPVSDPSFFGHYEISDYAGPDWEVDLFVNNRLVDFADIDEDGHFQFQVPLSYGPTHIDLKYYGPWGELETHSRLIQLPHNFVRSGEFEYSLQAGRLQNNNNQNYAHGGFRWGLTSRITLGGGIQHINDSRLQPFAPYATASIRLSDQALLHGKHIKGALSEGSLSFISPSRRSLQASYTLYNNNPIMNRANRKSEARLHVSLPFRINSRTLSTNFGIRASNQGRSRYVNFNAGLSGNLMGTYLNLRSQARMVYQGIDLHTQSFRSTLSLSKRIFYKIRLRQQLEYDHERSQVMRFGTTLERKFTRNSRFRFTYSRDALWGQNRFMVGFRINFPSARHYSTARSRGGSLSYNQTTSGTVGWDSRTNEVFTGNRSWVGKAGLVLQPYFESDEYGTSSAGIQGLTAEIKGGRTISSQGENMRLVDLNPYRNYFVEINGHSLDNPLWIPEVESYEIRVMPNRFNVIKVPILVVGEAVGSVTRISGDEAEGIRGARIIFDQLDGDYSTETTTYTGGDFFTIGLPPGEYAAHIDTAHIKRLAFNSRPDTIYFDIESTIHGAIVEGLDFNLYDEKIRLAKTYTIQVGAFINEHLADTLIKTLYLQFGKPGVVSYNEETQYFTSHIGTFDSKASAEEFIGRLKQELPELLHDAFKVPIDDVKSYTIQVGAFINEHLADTLIEALTLQFGKPGVVNYNEKTQYYNSHLGMFDSKASAEEFIVRLKQELPELLHDAFKIPIDDNINRLHEKDVRRAKTYTIQVGAFINEHLAVSLIDKLSTSFNLPGIITYDLETEKYHSHFGVFDSRASAEDFLTRLKRKFPGLIYDAFPLPFE
ncbi:MAG: SPOR domain-containing protein [Balneolales bacterium]